MGRWLCEVSAAGRLLVIFVESNDSMLSESSSKSKFHFSSVSDDGSSKLRWANELEGGFSSAVFVLF